MGDKPKLQIDTTSGNAFGIIGAVSRALRKSGMDQEEIDEYRTEAMSKDYNHLLQISMDYVDFE